MTEPVPEFYTVVYQVVGGKDVHNEWWQQLLPLFLADNAPISITVVSRGDLVEKVDELQAAAHAQQKGQSA